MLKYLSERNLISRQQHGFLSRHSTTTQLLECLQDWSVTIRDKVNMDVIYIDYRRAFDSCVYSKLLHKLVSEFGIHDALFNWIRAFLLGRTQSVVIDGVISKCYDVISGVPQGSVLGPLLFILFINDVVTVFNNDVSCKIFADDSKFYLVIDNEGINNPIKPALEIIHLVFKMATGN